MNSSGRKASVMSVWGLVLAECAHYHYNSASYEFSIVNLAF